ncbi:MAG: hypothetical protein OEW89_00595 [Gammaproteobacteria bacterium]|nr:hypothetical protein [Gammaproteobacteria bacterium]
MKVLLVINRPEREAKIMESIKREIHFLNQKAIVEIKERCTPEFNRFVFWFRPNVILTYPFTCEGFSNIYYMFKVILGAKIISMRAEGVVDFDSEYELERSVGYDDYGNNLVDYELSWGEKFARIIGEKLVAQNKLSSLGNFKVVGHPGLEKHFEHDNVDATIPLRLIDTLNQYNKNNIIFIVTGFVMADYTRQNLLDAKDMGGEDRIEIALEGVEIVKKLREDWINNIIIAATENPNVLIMVKKHPLENKKIYEQMLNSVNNILYIHEDVQMPNVISYAGLFIHYGSTSLIDAYLSKTPSVYASSHYNKQWYSNLGWPSDLEVDINEIPLAVKSFLGGNIPFKISDNKKKVMKEMFNIEEGKEYRPSKEIAKIILDPTPPQKVKITDTYFLRALSVLMYQHTFGRLLKLLKRV